MLYFWVVKKALPIIVIVCIVFVMGAIIFYQFDQREKLALANAKQKNNFFPPVYFNNDPQTEHVVNNLRPPHSCSEDAMQRVLYLKHVIEHGGGHKLFIGKDGKLIRKEKDLHVLYKLTCFGSNFNVSQEVNNGRGAVDFLISNGAVDKALIEFKLASNTKLKSVLKQVEIYEKANGTDRSIKVILAFNEQELKRAKRIVAELGRAEDPNIVLIDANASNKPSASTIS